MSSIVNLINSSALLAGIILAVVLMALYEIGQRIGVHVRSQSPDGPDEANKLVTGSILGLLAFVLALTLSNASSRFSQRQDAALAEANAISTAWLQAGVVGGDRAKALQDKIADYIKVRYAFARAPYEDAAIGQSNAKTNEMQNAIWADVTAVVQAGPEPRVATFMKSVNDMFDAATSMRYAMNYRMPAQILALLFGMTGVAMIGIGYQLGHGGQRDRRPVVVLAIVWSVVVVEIMDIGMSRIWTMTADVRMYDWTMQSMGIDPTKL